jgi:hypothetical protein
VNPQRLPGGLLLALLAGCSSIEWLRSPTTETWRGASLWCTGDVVVAATSESAAAGVTGTYLELRAAFAEVRLAAPPRPLLLVFDEDDPPLFADALVQLQTVTAWHRAIVDATASAGAMADAPVAPADAASTLPPDAPPEAVAAMAAVATGAVPLAAGELALPASWRALATWGVLVPTDDRIVRAADTILAAGLQQQGISFGQRLLLAPFMPWVRGMARDQLRGVVRRSLIEATASAGTAGGSLPPDTMLALLRAMRRRGSGRRTRRDQVR